MTAWLTTLEWLRLQGPAKRAALSRWPIPEPVAGMWQAPCGTIHAPAPCLDVKLGCARDARKRPQCNRPGYP